MPQVPTWAWICFVAVVGAGILSLLRSMAVQVRNGRALHDLRCRVFEVRIGYLKQIIATYQPLEGEVEIIEEDQPVPDEPRIAA
ncbi:MAG: hypothetical protein DYG94_09670 [Leptolyngbya sp. PLA3]|nr:MAG: hypothetical protein EDM82_08025 [Cyanobacteria bacterium CYA]MCE7968997.1 hypothetical protein [Leptolyngbya sp. PL-A3]